MTNDPVAHEFKDVYEYTDWLRGEIRRYQAEVERLRHALREILEDPDARILDADRENGWEALQH